MDLGRTFVYFLRLLSILALPLAGGEETTIHITNLVRHRRSSASSRSSSPPSTSSASSSTCSLDCSSVKVRPVCATDDKTYPSRCEVTKLHDCDGMDIRVKKKGPCSDSTAPKCFKERHQAQQQKKKSDASTTGIYIPECNSDGTFATIQCHKAARYCWCVTGDGKLIPGSSVRSKQPNCHSRGRGNKKKRGSRTKGKKGCSHTERSTFNTNLIALFTEEFERLQSTRANKTGNKGLSDTPDKRVVEWKFTELDTDQDNFLRKKEVKSLKRMVRRRVKPKACARNFIKHCDLDLNRKIARNEWSVCLGVDINISFRLFLLLNVEDQTTSTPSTVVPDKKDEFTDAAIWSAQLRPKASDDEEEEEEEDNNDEVKDCTHERRVALESHRADPNARIYIPKCTVDGKFRLAQCHESTKYCWCVDSNTGKPIPGISTYNVEPDCEKAVRRIIPGCPQLQKKKFLTTLIDTMTQEMVAENISDSRLPEPDPEHSLEERVVRWKLSNLDKNDNQALERREIRTLKIEVRNNNEVKKKKSLRKCAQSFVEYCDGDKNKKITIDEWLDCMGLTDEQQQSQLPRNPKRRGPNPFSKYLHS